jgi:hypothetical protein
VSGDVAIGIVSLVGALILFGRAVFVRRRAGDALGRDATIWTVILAVAFGLAWWLSRRT